MRAARRKNRKYKGSFPIRAFIGGVVVITFAILSAVALTPPSVATADSNAGHTLGAAANGSPKGAAAIRVMKSSGGPIEANDVVTYVQATGMPRTLGSRSSLTNVRAQLLTSAQISKRLKGESTGYPDNALLWFVQMDGTFVFPGPSAETVTAHVGYQVFDPATGNLIMFGSLG